MTDIGDTIAQLTELWPALAQALARDTTTTDGGTTGFTAATVVNADVLAAMVMLEAEVPAATRQACDTIAEPWQHRGLAACLRQLPRLASRMHDLGHEAAEDRLFKDTRRWLAITKRALGLRKPDIPLGYPCPWADTQPDNHHDAVMLISAGDEGFLRHGPDGTQVEWVSMAQIYCSAEHCGATWGPAQWPLLGRMIEQAGRIGA